MHMASPRLTSQFQGLGINLDWYRERTKETDPFTTGGFATNLSYEFDMLDAACGCEIDWVSSTNVVHVDVNIFDGRSWKFAWLLLLPLANYVKETFRWVGLCGGVCFASSAYWQLLLQDEAPYYAAMGKMRLRALQVVICTFRHFQLMLYLFLAVVAAWAIH